MKHKTCYNIALTNTILGPAMIRTDSSGNIYDDRDSSDAPAWALLAHTTYYKYKGNYNTPEGWAKYFGMSYNTFRKLRKKYHMDDLMPILEEKYRRVPGAKELKIMGPAEAHAAMTRGTPAKQYEYNGITKTIAEWADHFGINYQTFRGRVCKQGIYNAIEYYTYGQKPTDDSAPLGWAKEASSIIENIAATQSLAPAKLARPSSPSEYSDNTLSAYKSAAKRGFASYKAYRDHLAQQKGFLNYSEYSAQKRRERKKQDAFFDPEAYKLLAPAKELITADQHGALIKRGRLYVKHFMRRLELGMQPSRAYQEVMELYREHKREGAA